MLWHREKYVLFDNETKAKFTERSTMVIEQQLSHQWFGNLVTHSWWNDLWLSEGFARYFQYFVVDLVSLFDVFLIWNIILLILLRYLCINAGSIVIFFLRRTRISLVR